MKSFIKVIEVWTPDTGRKNLILADSFYDNHSNFHETSKAISFSYNEGLPGTAWAESRPIVITDLEHSCFVRKDAAKLSGISCAIGIPVFSGHYLLAVLVLLCGDESSLSGAIEVWGQNPERKNELHLVDGFYGSLEKFEWISRRISFLKGVGLPGMIWDYHIPQIVSDLSDSSTFLRATNAEFDGITTAFGIPLIYDKYHEFILTLLSAHGTPIATRFEIWLPNREHSKLILHHGHSEIDGDKFTLPPIEKGVGFLGDVWLTGCPAISRNPARDIVDNDEIDESTFRCSVAIPTIEEGILTAIVVFTL